MKDYLDALTTEQINTSTAHIDTCTTLDMIHQINMQDATIAAAVAKEDQKIANAVDLIYTQLSKNGRLIYVGAGTSGRLGVLDASECPPTFGVDKSLIQGHIAGGDQALRSSVENCEDNRKAGEKLIMDLKISHHDVLVGITASGRTPYVLGAIVAANTCGAKTIGLTTNEKSELEKITHVCIAPLVGAEVITGSTRMKSGTAQKMVLNMLSTCVMIKLGKVYGNLMVDLKASNEKLYARAKRLIMHATNIDKKEAERFLKLANGHCKLAILMIKTGLTKQESDTLLDKTNGRLSKAIEVHYENTSK